MSRGRPKKEVEIEIEVDEDVTNDELIEDDLDVAFPTIVYKVPGRCQREGGSYDWKGVNDELELKSAINDGWFIHLQGAIDAYNEV